MDEFKPGDIKYHVARFLRENASRFTGKTVVDLPAGNGISSVILRETGAHPLPFDLFPEYFKAQGMECKYSDVQEGIGLEDGVADAALCQEGIEHFSDQFKALCEFNRVLKKDGVLLITTPNYSGLRSRMSYFLAESEHFKKIMPPNEHDSVWMNSPGRDSRIYFGHLFLLGATRLRTLGKLAGFRLKAVHPTEKNTTSILLLPFCYPFIYFASSILLRRNLRKASSKEQKAAYREVFRLSTSTRILTGGHLFFEFEKELECGEVMETLKGVHKGFGMT